MFASLFHPGDGRLALHECMCTRRRCSQQPDFPCGRSLLLPRVEQITSQVCPVLHRSSHSPGHACKRPGELALPPGANELARHSRLSSLSGPRTLPCNGRCLSRSFVSLPPWVLSRLTGLHVCKPTKLSELPSLTFHVGPCANRLVCCNSQRGLTDAGSARRGALTGACVTLRYTSYV